MGVKPLDPHSFLPKHTYVWPGLLRDPKALLLHVNPCCISNRTKFSRATSSIAPAVPFLMASRHPSHPVLIPANRQSPLKISAKLVDRFSPLPECPVTSLALRVFIKLSLANQTPPHRVLSVLVPWESHFAHSVPSSHSSNPTHPIGTPYCSQLETRLPGKRTEKH